jgi:primary-amine oxidase
MAAESVSRRGFFERTLLGAGVAATMPLVLQRRAAALAQAAAPPHPLDPLSAAEIEAATKVLNDAGILGRGFCFVSTSLLEPPKEKLQAAGDAALARQAQVVLLDRESGLGFEAIVDLDKQQVASLKKLPAGVQPAMIMEECTDAEAAVRRSPKFQEALARRGIKSANVVVIDCWSAGHYGTEPAAHKNRRLTRPLFFLQPEADANPYARPIDGILAVVDLNTSEVLEVQDFGVVPIPPEEGRWDRDSIPEHRSGLKPLEIVQREGPSFTVQGQLVHWQNWAFRIGYCPREGLVLHTVSYDDGGRQRPIAHRLSICEMVVPYGDPGERYYRKNGFDVGEYLLGAMANPLTQGCDCLGAIRYFDVDVVDASGGAVTIKNAICLHEEDAGLLWKHTELRTQQTEGRRARRLSVSYIATAGNYDYAFYWHFYQDGSLACEVRLTGVMNTTAVPPGQTPPFGVLVAPQLAAPFHQHLFCARLDLDIDGNENLVQEVNTVSLPRGPENPHGNAFRAEVTPLLTEQLARRNVSSSSARFWRIVNPRRKNRLGQPAGYRLLPGENCPLLPQPDSAVARRAGFLSHNLWITPYRELERYAAGDYPNQHPGGDGLPRWTAANRSVDNTDVVLWYAFGHNHVPRLEDWPVMPVSSIGFTLRPDGFFDRNPALDLPPPA